MAKRSLAAIEAAAESSYDRFKRHFPKSRDITLIVLKGHLLVETELIELLELQFEKPSVLQKARLGFMQRLYILHALYPELFHSLAPCIGRLNSLRNALAHQLEPKDLSEAIAEMIHLIMTRGEHKPGPVPKTYTLHQLKLALAYLVGLLSGYKRGYQTTREGSDAIRQRVVD